MQPENLESRVTELEVQVRDLRDQVHASKHDAAAARVLAGAADRDVDEIRGELRDFRRATVAGINALREDMNDMGTGLRQEMRAKFDIMAAGQQKIVELIEVVIDAQGGNAPG